MTGYTCTYCNEPAVVYNTLNEEMLCDGHMSIDQQHLIDLSDREIHWKEGESLDF